MLVSSAGVRMGVFVTELRVGSVGFVSVFSRSFSVEGMLAEPWITGGRLRVSGDMFKVRVGPAGQWKRFHNKSDFAFHLWK